MRNLSMGKKYTPSGSASANSRIREKVEEKRENPGLMFRRPPSETPVQCCDVGKKEEKTTMIQVSEAPVSPGSRSDLFFWVGMILS
jgi:hypothetical protein